MIPDGYSPSHPIELEGVPFQMTPVLTFSQLEQYQQDGFLVLRQVFDDKETGVIQAECNRLISLDIIDRLNIRTGMRKVDGVDVIEKFDPVIDLSPVLTHLVQDERILSPLRDIYLDEPLLFKDKLIFKLPGNTGYTMHQDAAYWQGFPYRDLISVMVAIDGASQANGGLELFPGYHRQFLSVPGELRNMNEQEANSIDTTKGQLVETQPGDIIIFHSLVPHRSGPNTAESSRRQLYLTYTPSRNGQLYKAHYQHYQRYTGRSKSAEENARRYFR
jgi:ectoine hydroxylase-related dioxygenase (phytanoyl-CoA dioxygenase family)